ncbi:MAG: hypothetical protein ACE5Q6_19230, partial [Dehalococcoidia bacterium]
AANLVCRIPGLPDKALNLTNNEQVSFLLRRDMQDVVANQVKEHALVNGGWQPLEPGEEQQKLDGEQQFPMFPVTYQEFEDRSRRMFAGLVPVGGREAYLNARRQPVSADTENPTLGDDDRIEQLLTVLEMEVLVPWHNINLLWSQEDASLQDSFAATSSTSERRELRDTIHLVRDKLQTASWYVLLDLAYYLRDNLLGIWNRIDADPDAAVPIGRPGRELIQALQGARFRPETRTSDSYLTLGVFRDKLQGRTVRSSDTSMAQALKEVYAAREDLESATADYVEGGSGWPSTKFLLCGRDSLNLVDSLRGLVFDALQEEPPEATKLIPLLPLLKEVVETADESDVDNDQFVIRCVFERPNCPPSLRPTVVSQPSEPFTMASYFDPDAPARPIRIPLPVDTSPAGLRKFSKNTMFVLSDTLACQVERARGLGFGDLVRSVLPWPLHKNLDTSAGDCVDGKLEMGKLCTLSIPIITICALILLIIIVSLLDIIFKWVPYLMFCLPIPGLKAKGSGST